ncbi:uncharacterized protein LOC106152134 [Lingula anatina]|uniref:Uncharacterized protein LOC106152134 n=1 Tax=Lingula anatina TaxID=7574 RepID=A0A1S3H7I3_LINAN|nr:uncharacterized protein LOC106152134 [Lingula anatina]|eukprot:XP_013381079.1 uncharacterized protein LOC106152134 [Lingula anatina]
MLTWKTLAFCVLTATILKSGHNACVTREADIAFLLDVTGVAGDAGKIGNFIKTLANDSFIIGPNNVSVAVISFIPSVTAIITLDREQSYGNIWRSIDTITVDANNFRGSQASRALSYTRSSFLNPSHAQGGRHNTRKIIVLMTTDLSPVLCRAVKNSVLAKNQSIEVFVIGIGNKVNIYELQALSSDPVDTHALAVQTFGDLEDVTVNISTSLCAVPTTPSTDLTSTNWYHYYKRQCPDPTTTTRTTSSTARYDLTLSTVTTKDSSTVTSGPFTHSDVTCRTGFGCNTRKQATSTSPTNAKNEDIFKRFNREEVIIFGLSGAVFALAFLCGLCGLFLYLTKRRLRVEQDRSREGKTEGEDDVAIKKKTDDACTLEAL